MAASVFDSPLYAKSFPCGDARQLFTDSAAVRAVLLVAGTAAKAQGELGLIPQDSAFFIHRSAMEVQIDPAGLAQALPSKGFAPAVLEAFEKAMESPEHAKFIGFEVDLIALEAIALTLRLRQYLSYCAGKLDALQPTCPTVATRLDELKTAKDVCIGFAFPGDADAQVAPAVAAALNLPLKDAMPSPLPILHLCANISADLAQDAPDHPTLRQLAGLTRGLFAATEDAPSLMEPVTLPQICLAAASSLEIAIANGQA
ncbi:hypothetical protein [Cognatishimia maritima]|uniref:Uncharacterized protein n=1 Tax=Cognatishimia maritima TaxID=870908 RepID=A0A1M5KDS8_9RHOB|nr:hypothetical protein [Cognatishimia maritima]SHG50861.1 hypothetical protein SAMN04488044_0939 [Cognatishimia maritima]